MSLTLTGAGSATATAAPPSTPTGFAATAQESEIDLIWDAQPEADNFDVYYGLTNDQGSSTILLTGYVGTSYTFGASDSIQPGEKYYFWISATNGVGTSSFSSSVTARSYVTLAPSHFSGLTTPAGTWTIGTLFFGSSPDPLPNGVSLSVVGNSYTRFDGDWYDASTEELANDVSISGAFTIANNSGGSITIWNGEP